MNKKSKTALSAIDTDSVLRRALIVFPYLWLVLFFLIPFLYVFKISFSTPILAQPPYSQIFDFSQNFKNYSNKDIDNIFVNEIYNFLLIGKDHRQIFLSLIHI